MFRLLKSSLLVLFCVSILVACGDNDVPKEKGTATTMQETAVQLPAETPDLSVVELVEEASTETEMVETEITFLPNHVVYQEEIYKNWPYTEAPAANGSDEAIQNATDAIEDTLEGIAAE